MPGTWSVCYRESGEKDTTFLWGLDRRGAWCSAQGEDQKGYKGVYEASAIDGANKWEQFWKVTFPAINPTIIINVVFTTVMQSIFALNPIILKIQSDMNDTSEGKGYGYSSALAFTYFLVMIIVLVIFVLIFKRKEKKKGGY